MAFLGTTWSSRTYQGHGLYLICSSHSLWPPACLVARTGSIHWAVNPAAKTGSRNYPDWKCGHIPPIWVVWGILNAQIDMLLIWNSYLAGHLVVLSAEFGNPTSVLVWVLAFGCWALNTRTQEGCPSGIISSGPGGRSPVWLLCRHARQSLLGREALLPLPCLARVHSWWAGKFHISYCKTMENMSVLLVFCGME